MISPFLPFSPVHSLYLCSCPPHFSFHYLFPDCIRSPSLLFSISNAPFIFSSPIPPLFLFKISCLCILVISNNLCYFLSYYLFIHYSLSLYLSAGQFWDASLEEEVVRLGWFLSVLLQRWVVVQEKGLYLSTGHSTWTKWLATCSASCLFVFSTPPQSYIQARTKLQKHFKIEYNSKDQLLHSLLKLP